MCYSYLLPKVVSKYFALNYRLKTVIQHYATFVFGPKTRSSETPSLFL